MEKGLAPDFQLKDQFGREIALSELRGKVVVMSFLYTHCPDICPITTSRFMSVAKALGSEVERSAVFLAVTVDPERDTVDKLKEYSAAVGMLDRWHFLTGSYREVELVWSGYDIYVNKTIIDAPGNYIVDHSVIVVVIDKQGYIREYFPSPDWKSEDLLSDVRMLMRE